jgi:hypothetical protein
MTVARPIYVNDAYLPYFQFGGRYVFMRGGAGSGKSVSWAQKHVMKVASRPGRRVLVIRKVGATLRQSVFEQLRKVVSDWGLAGDFTANQTTLRLRHNITGSELLCAGIDDPEKLKSITGITDIVIEEATELTEDDFSQLDLRARDVSDVQITVAFNPIDEGHWLKKRIDVQQGQADTLVVLTTFKDNRFLPDSYVQTLLNMARTNPNYHRIYVLNEWGRVETGNEFYPNFDKGKHTGVVPYLPGLPIWQSWDANSLPYCAMFCAQIEDKRSQGGGRTLRVFQEYAIGSPNSGLRNTGHAFLRDRQRHGWQDSAVMLTGDASLRARKPSDERSTAFDDVQAALNGYEDADGNRVPGCLNSRSAALWPKRNPEVMRRRDFVNYLLAGGFPDIAVLIDAAACPKLVTDMELVQLGDDSKLKEMYNDPVLGVRYQKLGHMSDDFDYIVCTVFEPEYTAFKAGRGG